MDGPSIRDYIDARKKIVSGTTIASVTGATRINRKEKGAVGIESEAEAETAGEIGLKSATVTDADGAANRRHRLETAKAAIPINPQ
ncbi:hypothetical protein IW147_002451 [Coemansia sp. RSA 720]|nr:hypothetical protein IW147_002451 [Coemansia sp. RSA 720]